MPSRERVAVLFGGRSVEHEVSVITAHQAMDALEVAGFAVLPIYVTKDGAWYAGRPLNNLKLYADRRLDLNRIRDVFRVSLSPDRGIRELVPVQPGSLLFGRPPALWADVFFPTIHGTYGEDGTLQGLFEVADVPYVGSGLMASAIAMDKVRTKALCRAAGLPVLDSISVTRDEWKSIGDAFAALVTDFCGYPAMVKPVNLGSSIGVVRSPDSISLRQAVETALVLDERVLVERALSEFIEINCAVLGPPTRTSVCEQPVTSSALLSFDDKYRRGVKPAQKDAVNPGAASGSRGGGKAGMAGQERLVPAPISSELTARVRALAAQVFELIGASGVARVDFLYEPQQNALYVNELNTMPGSLAFYLWEATGLPFDALVTELVEIAKRRHQERAATQFTFEANLLVPPK